MKKNITTGITLFMAIFLLTGLTATAQAEAATVTTNENLQISRNVYMSCTDEWVHIEGTRHGVHHVTRDEAGGIHITSHYNLKRVSGTGLTSGADYKVVGTSQYKNSFNSNEGMTYNYVENFKISNKETGEKHTIHMDVHITYSPNGTVTSYHSNLRDSCK